MNEFEVGDRVVVLDTADTTLNREFYRAGAIGEVVSFDDDCILVKFLPNQVGVDYACETWYVQTGSLQKVEV
jgi:ribosomal protein L21E